MPPALDRLLASPSALRLLRSIVNAPELPAACSAATKCCPPVARRRNYSTQPKPQPKLKWRRMKDASEHEAVRDHVLKALQRDESSDTLIPTADIFETDVVRVAEREDDPAQLAAILANEERLHGKKGVRNVWQNFRRRGYRLPTEDTSDAAFLWGTFVKNHLITDKAIEHAEELLHETGKTYPGLYYLVMSHWLPRRTAPALRYHYAIQKSLKPQRLPLRQLAHQGRSTYKHGAYEALMEIYEHSNERDLYDEVVPALIEKDDITAARRWHALCTLRNDMPSESVASHPLVQLFTVEDSAREVYFDTKGSTKKWRRGAAKYDENLLRRLEGPDTAPVRFEDSFVARMFATRTFPPASIIQGLSMVGINEIGPQAVLTMALQTQPVEELPMRFEELRQAGIALQGCVFSLALETFAMEQKWQLVRSMLQSDQHPDVFGDVEMQRKLLEHYLDNDDYAQVQRTLAILTLFHNDSSQESWNLLLQVYIKRSGQKHVVEVLQDMRARGIMVSPESIMATRSLLRRRQRGHKPVSDRFDDLRFVARVFVMILENGLAPISPLQWREIIRRFGMVGRFRELRRLLLWLLCWYAPRSSYQFSTLPKSPFLEPATAKLRAAYPERFHYFHFPTTVTQRENLVHPVRQLFAPSLQQSLIIWGFKAGLLPNAPLEQSMLGPTLAKKHYRRRLLQRRMLRRLEWSAGLRIVVHLRNLGVIVHYHTVLKALQSQFINMFGHGRSKKRENRVVERSNTLPYARYVHEVNKIWGSPLLREPQLFGKGMVHDHMWHPRMRRNIKRRASISLGEILGPNWRDRDQEIHTAAKQDENAAISQLQKHFKKQAKAIEPGSELQPPSTIAVSRVQIDNGKK
ncbi:uncharacterized protein J4E78_005738 [Alternaria triticimaculans]|uniref:uncharacterized protein n=1 Tax=Alternaria triticimaculans TaxID=297637 RepID=UPI0020C34D42|nr:uncharacterized protein J4E78_005738 [Alternaria triticimaculans]KAI4659311.1 hypothetical protein J4E78_005738 [Alternaria triticimaculans]